MKNLEKLNADEAIASLMNDVEITRSIFGKYHLLEGMVRLAHVYGATEKSYRRIYKIALKDLRLFRIAHLIFKDLDADLLADYRKTLVQRGRWIRLEEVVRFSNTPLSKKEIIATSNALETLYQDDERGGFSNFIRRHEELSYEEKLFIMSHIPEYLGHLI